jgi:F-type H+-transporting ATPase subunit b
MIMRCVLTNGFLAVLVGMVWGSWSHGLRAEEPAGHAEARYTVTYEDAPDHEAEKAFDLHKPQQAKELSSLLESGKVKEMKKDEPPPILAFYYDLGLWTLIVFGLLYWVLSKLAWKPMLEGLKRREDFYHNAMEEAKKARAEAQTLREQWQKEMDKANEKAGEVLEGARRQGKELTDDMIAKARTEIQSERGRLRREIDTARDQALHQLWNQAAQLATLVSAKAIRRNLTQEDHRRLVDEALNELASAGNQSSTKN